jgi:hypothetical protein
MSLGVLFYVCDRKWDKENEGKNTFYFRCSLQSKVECLSLRTFEFEPRAVHVEFMVDRVALGQVFLRILWLSTVVSFHHCSIIIH